MARQGIIQENEEQEAVVVLLNEDGTRAQTLKPGTMAQAEKVVDDWKSGKMQVLTE